MGSVWVAPPILFLLFFSFLTLHRSSAWIEVLGNRNIGESENSIIRTYKHLVPRYCHNSFETIQCFDKCKNDPDIEKAKQHITEEKHLEDYINVAVSASIRLDKEGRNQSLKVKSMDERPGRGIPCSNKCETDPVYWSCVSDCDDKDHTTLWKARCFHNGSTANDDPVDEKFIRPCHTNQSEFLLVAECKRCIVNATRARLKHTCEIAYLPDLVVKGENLCEKMDPCDHKHPHKGEDINAAVDGCAGQAKDNVEMMQLCVNDKIMYVQRECCYSEIVSNITGCKKDLEKCDDLCISILSPRLCREKCEKFRNPKFEDCFENVCDFYFSIDPTICDHCDNTTTEYQDFVRNKNCVEKCDDSMECVRNCLPFGGSASSVSIVQPPKYLVDNCHSQDYLGNYSRFVLQHRLKHYWPFFVSFSQTPYSGWPYHYRLPFECENGICQGDNAKKLDSKQVEQLCVENPFRVIDLLACALVQPDPDLITLDSRVVIEDDRFIQCVFDQEFEVTQARLYKLVYDYELERVCTLDYCKQSSTVIEKNPLEHPNIFSNVKCRIFGCQEEGFSPYCRPKIDDHVADLEDHGHCRWIADFARHEDPYSLWSTYFNELHPSEIKSKLEYPDATTILSQALLDGRRDYYSFPYFIIIRSICQGDYYSDENYQYTTPGNSPVVEMKFLTTYTNRHWPKNLFEGVFKTALIDLNRNANDKQLVPENPRRRNVMVDNEVKSIGCPENICFPAFAAPVLFVNVPKFNVVVLDKEEASLYSQAVYTAQFHSRAVPGVGAIYDPGDDGKNKLPYGPSKPPAHPGHLFPVKRSTFMVDSELNYHQNCIANGVTDKLSKEYNQRKCPELDHILDDFDNPYPQNIFAPLDAEDIFRSQYTYGTAPTQAIAGFYDPKYIIIGDADMNKFEIVDWSKLLTDMESINYNESSISCIQFEFQNREHNKPIYSQLDRTDSTYPVKFFRMRYAPKAYYTTPEAREKHQYADTAIFEAIGLEDRLLLITSKGLVSFYGHSHATVKKNKAFKYEHSETLNKCFKIVRILSAAQPDFDLIVGITYDYIVANTRVRNETFADDEERYIKVAQEIWVGRFTNAGENIKWMQVKSKPKELAYIDTIDLPPIKADGHFVPFKPDKEPGLGQAMREANPPSEIEAVCYKAFRTKMNHYPQIKDKLKLVDEAGWCAALDATPVQLKDAIQVLIRMRTYYNKDNTKLYFYIVATHELNQLDAEVVWVIDSIIPRYPCVNEHLEAVKHVTAFDERYFQSFQVGSYTVVGCHASHEDRLDYHIFLSGMTYSRALSNHLFLYGSRLLQSFNGGRTFVLLKSGFPRRFLNFGQFGFPGFRPVDGDDVINSDNKKNRPVHRIVKMAFDDGGHYAFLTNKLELWLGSTGAERQILLRPSPLQSMVQLGVSQVRNVHDGVPFAIDYDSNNRLYEMVAIVGENGHVTRVMKRLVNEWKILKVKTLLEKFKEESDRMYEQREKSQRLTTELQRPFSYDIPKWSILCGYRSPSLRQNFSKTYSRSRATYFPHPEQHLNWGRAHREASLLTFQAITFTLVWESYFDTPNRFYAGQDKDPYISWVVNKKFAAFATMKTTLFSQQYPPEEHSIMIQPLKYKRIIVSKVHAEVPRQYYIDYNVTVELKLEFSLRHEQAVFNTEFKEDQINSLELNVENSNGTIIQVNTEKEIRAHDAAVLFIIRMSVRSKSRLSQTFPGQRYIPVPVTYHLVGAFGNCIQDKNSGLIGDKIEAIMMVGCPPNRDFVFDWNATLRSIEMRNDRIEGRARFEHGIGAYCYRSEYVCFFARSPSVIHFEIYDETKQRFLPYTGKFIMRIIGGGESKDSIKLYSQEEIAAFNIKGVSDASLIWSEWDAINHQKIDRRAEPLLELDGNILQEDSRESILQSGMSTISWVCHTLSPCARIAPTKSLEVVYWFRIFVTNRDVDSDTLCLYEKEFDVMLYGFPPSPEFKLLATLGFCFVMLSVMYIGYLCNRQGARVWHATKRGTINWYYIIKDAIPKKLRYYELPLPEEPEKPEKYKKHRGFGSEEPGSLEASWTSIDENRTLSGDISSNLTRSNSSATIDSTSVIESSHLLPSANRLRTTTQQIMYDQILTKRLNSIVERNRALRANLIRKASVPMVEEDNEQETKFRLQFGRTVSQESGFTPPMPKDRKERGIESFL